MQTPAGCLNVILQHLASRLGVIPVPHRFGPDPPCHPADDTILRVHAVAEKEGEIRCKIINEHPPAEVIFNEGESVGQSEGKLGHRVRSGFSDVITADGDAVEIPDLVVDEIRLYVTHHLKREFGAEDAGILSLVLLQDVRLDSSPNLSKRILPDGCICSGIEHFIACQAQQPQPRPIAARRQSIGMSGIMIPGDGHATIFSVSLFRYLLP